MREKILFKDDNELLGHQESLFNKVAWSKNSHFDIAEYFKVAFNSKTYVFDFDQPTTDPKMKLGNQYFHNLGSGQDQLSSIYNNDYGSTIPESKPQWEGRLNMSRNNFLAIDTLVLKTSQHHVHSVLRNLSFEDIGVNIAFERNDGSTYIHYTPLPALKNYTSYVGTEGAIGSKKNDYQIGLKQVLLYYVRLGSIYLGIRLELSATFLYHANDFEPLGVIDAVKFFPQIKFSSDSINIFDSVLYPDAEGTILLPNLDSRYNLLSLQGLPQDIDLNSGRIHSYKARVKMTANNNNSHHVDIVNDGAGHLIDFNHFKKLREEEIPIPSMFEKYFYTFSVPSNIPGFFVDSNASGEDEDKKTRKFPAYHVSAEDPPTWAFIFDYLKPNITQESEIVAVYGKQDLTTKPDSFNERSKSYIYPPNNPSNTKITLTKTPRQGEYDNIHFHGYMGHYADNDQIVIHAPICGFCCFHLHWRWSKLNYTLNTGTIAKMLNSGGQPTKFNGWNNFGEKSGDGFGLPLIPPNQSLKIAITNETKIPFSRDSVLNPQAQPETLDIAVKSIWYSVDILDDTYFFTPTGFVVLEQGAGYAFQYNQAIERTYKFARSNIKVINFLLPKIPSMPTVIIAFINEVLSKTELKDWFEVVYRLMRFYNWDSQYPNTNQIPNGNYKPDANKPSMEKL